MFVYTRGISKCYKKKDNSLKIVIFFLYFINFYWTLPESLEVESVTTTTESTGVGEETVSESTCVDVESVCVSPLSGGVWQEANVKIRPVAKM